MTVHDEEAVSFFSLWKYHQVCTRVKNLQATRGQDLKVHSTQELEIYDFFDDET